MFISSVQHNEAVERTLVTAGSAAYVVESNSGDLVYRAQAPSTVLCAALSPDGTRLAVVSIDKQLQLFATDADPSEWQLRKSWTLAKRVSRIMITAQNEILTADRFGDVYRYTEAEDKGVLCMGHVSMLTDFALTPAGDLLITAERDEKVRITQYPKTHVIDRFLFGHTEFVSAIAVLDDQMVVSAGGDGKLMVWEYTASSRPVQTLDVYETFAPLVSKQLPKLDEFVVRQMSFKNDVLAILVDKYPGVLLLSVNQQRLSSPRVLDLATPYFAMAWTRDGSLMVHQYRTLIDTYTNDGNDAWGCTRRMRLTETGLEPLSDSASIESLEGESDAIILDEDLNCVLRKSHGYPNNENFGTKKKADASDDGSQAKKPRIDSDQK